MARRAVHNGLSVAAIYIATPTASPQTVSVRVHTRFEYIGAAISNDAERQEVSPKIVFLKEQVPAPRVNSVVSIDAGEAYRIVSVQPSDDITIKCDAVRLSSSEATGLPVP